MEAHRKNPVCAACHAQMDPLGFALENFDARRQVADATARRRADRRVGVAARRHDVRGRRRVARRCCSATARSFVRTFTEKLLTYAFGRGVEYYDLPAVRTIVQECRAEDYRWSSLILGIVKSLPFTMSTSASLGNGCTAGVGSPISARQEIRS